jgi:hypothetical protein
VTQPLDRRIADLAGADVAGRLRQLNAAIAIRAEAGGAPDFILWRSVERLLRHPARETRLAALAHLLERRIEEIAPPVETLRGRIFAPALGLARALSASFGLSVSAPAADAALAALSFVERRWSDDGRLVLKLRLGVFLDAEDRLCWEFGVVGRRPSLSGLNAGLAAAAALAPSYAAVIDLTPSGYHAARLAIRLGGRAPDHAAFLRDLAAIRNSARHHPGTRLSPHRVGALLERGGLSDPQTGRVLAWAPPRLLRQPI